MATHSSILGWIIPWTEEPGGFQSMGLQSYLATEHAFFLKLFKALSVSLPLKKFFFKVCVSWIRNKSQICISNYMLALHDLLSGFTRQL